MKQADDAWDAGGTEAGSMLRLNKCPIEQGCEVFAWKTKCIYDTQTHISAHCVPSEVKLILASEPGGGGTHAITHCRGLRQIWGLGEEIGWEPH